jgi:hypothetical protein
VASPFLFEFGQDVTGHFLYLTHGRRGGEWFERLAAMLEATH